MLFRDARFDREDSGQDQVALARALLRRAARSAALLRATSAGLAYAPTLDERLCSIERARERLLQFERAAAQYAELTGADLLSDAEPLLGGLPLPSSWPEAALAQLLLALAGRVELESHPGAAGSRVALACETEHANAARAALDELSPSDLPPRELSQAFVRRWIRVAYASLESERREQYAQALASVIEPMGIQLAH